MYKNKFKKLYEKSEVAGGQEVGVDEGKQEGRGARRDEEKDALLQTNRTVSTFLLFCCFSCDGRLQTEHKRTPDGWLGELGAKRSEKDEPKVRTVHHSASMQSQRGMEGGG